MSGFGDIEFVFVPRIVITETQGFLRSMGQRGYEGLVLWAGQSQGREFRVTNPLIPHQRASRTADGVFTSVDAEEMYRINLALFKSQLRLIAQVHSHPTEAYHSDTDDQHALVNTVGSLSLVVPDFAARSFNLDDTAVYRLDGSGIWQELGSRVVHSLIWIEG